MSEYSWKIKGGKDLGVSPFCIIGILNVTPDSFYDGRKSLDYEDAVDRGLRMADEGAGIIDVGGESTRPGSRRVSAAEEISRVVPVIKALAGKTGALLSCDTYKGAVAEKALEAGASIINDISAFSMDKGLLSVVRDSGCGYVLMHMQGTPADMQDDPSYEDVESEISLFFERSLGFLEKNGIDPGKVAIDPGIGFGKRLEDNLRILNGIGAFRKFGRPVMVGASRKSFIGKILDGLPAEQRLGASLACAVVSYLRGACIFRVHDVAETARVLRVARAIESASGDLSP